MKKYQLKIAVLTLSALAFFSSCKKDDKPTATGDVMTFTGTIGGGAKTEINGLEMKWSTGDKVVINGVDCTSDLTNDRTTATFTGVVVPTDKYEAYYPTSLYKNGDYVLPEIQYYNGGNLSKVNPMYAYSATTDLQFYNICALMKLVVRGEGKVKTITVSANKGGNPALLSGAFAIKGDASAGFYAEMKSASDGGSTSLTLDCGEAGVHLSSDPENPTIFYIAMPKGEYSDLVFTFKADPIDSVWSSSPVTRKLEAGEMHVRELAGVSVVKPEKLPGVFTVNGSGKQVQ